MGGVSHASPASCWSGRPPCERIASEQQGAAGCRLIIVLDTRGVTALAPIDERSRARLRVVREQATDLIVAAAVLAEGVLTGHVAQDFHVRRLLELVDVADVDEELGYAAGSLRQAAMRAGVDPAPSGVDAIVAALADARATDVDVRILTSDKDDIELLAALGEHAHRLSVVVV